jgi:signal transduction histidine kinase
MRSPDHMVFIGDDIERMKAIEALLIEAHETERTRVARELHDDIGQRMAVLTMDLDALSKALPLPTAEVRARIDALSNRAIDLALDIQSLSHRLYPAKLEYLGLLSVSASFCRDVSKQRHVEIAFSHEGVPETVPTTVALSVFRVLQEAVTNAVKHAGVGHVTVALGGSPVEIRVDVVDAGMGFDPDAVLSGHAPGLIGMRERARLLGGEVIIRSRPGAGTSISARVPLSAADRPAAAPR